MSWLIVGLGNPGKKYERTRHNVGWQVFAFLGERWALDLDVAKDWHEKFESLIAETKVGGAKVILMKPLTYVNESGRAVRQAVDFWKIAPDHVIVVHDDKDLPVGTLRLRPDGSSGGHNGIKSVIAHLGTENFHRVRVGIGTDRPTGDTADFVLATFRPDEKAAMKDAERRAAEAVTAIIDDGIIAAMNKFNG